MDKPQRYDENKLPVWARLRIQNLRNTIKELEAYRTMHSILEDKDRDWFTLPDPFNGCTEEELNLWILTKNHPFSVCVLYKGDLLFIGRAHKQRYGKRLVESLLDKPIAATAPSKEPKRPNMPRVLKE